MPNKKAIALVTLGAVLVVSALALSLYNRQEDVHAGQEAENLLEGIHAALEDTPAPLPDVPLPSSGAEEPAPVPALPEEAVPTAAPEPLDPAMPEVAVKGYACVGYLYIPVLELELPVLSQWDYERLQVAPCRQFGSSRTDDLVIAGHNYPRHFGTLKNLLPGDEILFTDMEGIANRYTVSRVETLPPDAVDVVQGSTSALILYTCTPGGSSRVSVFCDRLGEDAS